MPVHLVVCWYYSSPPPSRLKFKVLVERRSLLLVKDDLYHDYLHGIEEVEEDVVGPDVVNANVGVGERVTVRRGTRVSLTIRNVPKTSKLKIQL